MKRLYHTLQEKGIPFYKKVCFRTYNMEKVKNTLTMRKNSTIMTGAIDIFTQKGFLIMAKEYKITSLRLADLEKELNYLKTTREREIAAMIAEARSYGDLSENSEYDAAKNEQAKLYGRIAEIEDILSHAVIIEDENEATGRVGLGCTVVVEDANGKQTEYRITGSQEANPMERKLSDDSPFGRAIVGKAAGDTFTVNAPAGSFTMKVVSVSREG